MFLQAALFAYIPIIWQDCSGDQLVTCEDYVMIHKVLVKIMVRVLDGNLEHVEHA